MTRPTPDEVLRELRDVQEQIVRITQALEYLPRLEGRRDALLRDLLDLEGAHDQRPVAVR
jgi:hypothetical protein